MRRVADQLPRQAHLPCLDYAQVFTASSIWNDNGQGGQQATFDVTIREMPGRRNFLILGGIETVVRGLKDWRYPPDFIAYLKKRRIISGCFAEHLSRFSFRGDLWAMPEGTICFPGEPVIRVTAPLADANLFTAFLVNAITYPTLFLSKGARVKLAANGKPFFIGGAIRALSFENVLAAQRLGYLLGSINALPFTEYYYGVAKSVPAVSYYHAVIKSFNDEPAAYRALMPYAKHLFATSMIDTYDFKSGLRHWIAAELQARKSGISLGRVSIDSGNLFSQAVYIRRQLDLAGLRDTQIVAYSNLDEYKIARLEARAAPIDIYCAVTEVLTASDRPVLEAVYKLAELVRPDGDRIQTAKLTPGKTSLPGRKQVFRRYSRLGMIAGDTIGYEDENCGQPLLVQYLADGRTVRPLPSLINIKAYVERQLQLLPQPLLSPLKPASYEVRVSGRLKRALERLRAARHKTKSNA